MRNYFKDSDLKPLIYSFIPDEEENRQHSYISQNPKIDAAIKTRKAEENILPFKNLDSFWY